MLPKDMCKKCKNRKTCKTPCAFVEAILSEDNKTPFYERNTKGQDDQPIKLIKSKNWRREINETNLDQYGKSNLVNDNIKRTPFTTEAENPFETLKPQLSQTTVFINRFFLRKDYKEIATEMDVPVDTIVSMFMHAKNRLLEALGFADNRHMTIERYKSLLERNEKAFGKLPKRQKYYLMNRVLGLTIPEIAEIEDVTPHRVHSSIKEVSDQLKTGKIVWLECGDEERKAAQARIDKKKERDRKNWNKKKVA